MSKRALIVIDLQNDYFEGGKWTLEGIDAAAAKAARLIGAFRDSGEMIVHVRHEFPTADAPFFAPGSPGAEINPVVSPADGETVLLKHSANAFKNTDLKDLLDRGGIEDVVICGAMSHICIDGTTRAAADMGYRCTLIHDACASRDLQFNDVTVPAANVHAAFMAALGSGYAQVTAADAFLQS